VYTIGHSTRPLAELADLLGLHRVRILVDIRRMPRSRHSPQFNGDTLRGALAEAGIEYRHEPRLGGLRRPAGESAANRGWRTPGFRAFADYMQTAEFAAALGDLLALAGAAGPVAIMCAEAVPWRCPERNEAD
jgi:uncharacterized protein (DUF488 family)